MAARWLRSVFGRVSGVAMSVDMVARAAGLVMPIGRGPRRHPHPGCLGAYDSGYPGGMLAFIRRKFVGSYLALRAVSRVHCWPLYAWRTRSLASSLVKFT